MKTASGIKSFQEDKGFGKWFNTLLPLVQSRASCQPEQTIEPSSCTRRKATSQLDPVGSYFQNNEGEEENDDTNCENLCLKIQRIKIHSSLHCLFQQGERKNMLQ